MSRKGKVTLWQLFFITELLSAWEVAKNLGQNEAKIATNLQTLSTAFNKVCMNFQSSLNFYEVVMLFWRHFFEYV